MCILFLLSGTAFVCKGSASSLYFKVSADCLQPLMRGKDCVNSCCTCIQVQPEKSTSSMFSTNIAGFWLIESVDAEPMDWEVDCVLESFPRKS